MKARALLFKVVAVAAMLLYLYLPALQAGSSTWCQSSQTCVVGSGCKDHGQFLCSCDPGYFAVCIYDNTQNDCPVGEQYQQCLTSWCCCDAGTGGGCGY